MQSQISNALKIFIQEVQTEINSSDANRTTEHSFRPALKKLLESLGSNLQALNEPKRQSVGAPDFIIFRGGVQVAFLEAKDFGEKLDDKKHKNQLERYQALGNLCFTNNLDWQFFDGKELVGKVCIGKIDERGKIKLFEENLNLLAGHLLEFVNRNSVTIKNSRELAQSMAQKARSMRETLVKILISDLTIFQFADIYAQTISYGLFTARYYDQSLSSFSRHEAANNLPKSNPFLRKLFQTIAGYDLDPRLSWVVDNLVEIFVHTNVRELMHNFGIKLNLDDPVLHFYETFLSEYDPSTRKSRGVYYTPDPVVKFMVKSVDEILQKEFDLPMGLADNSKIQKKLKLDEALTIKNPVIKTKANNHKEYFEEFHKVQILDPATGTGTFLLEVFNQIYNKFKNNLGIWQSYAQKDLLPRVHGFEILMASYTMVHLKLAMFLTEKEVEIKNRLSVYLTNSLEEGIPNDGSLFSLSKWLTDEAEAASKIKNETPVMVVIGNPPYSGESSNKGQWMMDLIQDYKKDLGERKLNLDDDYIKFICYGQHFIEKNGEGILAYISNNSFIDGVTHRRMRESLLQTFDKIYILDLHGNSKKKETALDGSKDENVFDIQQGVSINLFIKTGKKKDGELGQIHHQHLYGKRDKKYDFLLNNSVSTVDWLELKPDPKYHFFVPKNFDEQVEWEKGIKVSELFKLNSSGIETAKDALVYNEKDSNLKSIKGSFLEKEVEVLAKLYEIKSEKVREVKNDILNSKVIDVAYKVFQNKKLLWSKNSQGVVWRPRNEAVKQYLNVNLSLILMRSQVDVPNFKTVFISNYPCDKNFYGFQTYFFPLYLYPENDGDLLETQKPRPNFNPEITNKLKKNYK